MGMAGENEGRAATAGATPPPASNGAKVSVVATAEAEAAGTCETSETSEEKERRLRSNSEETALILTSMMSMAPYPAPAPAHHDSDDDGDGSRHSDMGEDQSGDEHDDMDMGEYQGKGKGRVHQVHFEGPTGSKLDFTDDAGFNHRFRNESNRVKSLVTKHISIDELREHFDRPIIDVAKDFGICITLMKKICRRNGIKRWPHRQIRSLSKSIASMEAAMLSAQGSEREKYRDQILSLKLKRDAVIADPNKENSMARPKTPTKDGSSRPHTHVHAAPKLSPRSGSPTGSAGTAATPKGDGQSHSKGGRWTSEEHAAFLHGIRLYGKDWRRVAQVVRTRSAVQTRTHAQKYLLKFAGRFPFDADGLDLKEQHEQERAQDEQDDDGDRSMASVVTPPKEKEINGDTASMSSSSLEEDAANASTPTLRVDTVDLHKSALETMAMILNSPQFHSFRDRAPPPLQIEQRETDESADVRLPPPPPTDDVVMESPRGVPTTLPLLPSFVIKPSEWPAPPRNREPPAASAESSAAP